MVVAPHGVPCARQLAQVGIAGAEVHRSGECGVVDVLRVDPAVSVGVRRDGPPALRDELHRTDRPVEVAVTVERAAVAVADDRGVVRAVEAQSDDRRARPAVGSHDGAGESTVVRLHPADAREQAPRHAAGGVALPQPQLRPPVRHERGGRDATLGEPRRFSRRRIARESRRDGGRAAATAHDVRHRATGVDPGPDVVTGPCVAGPYVDGERAATGRPRQRPAADGGRRGPARCGERGAGDEGGGGADEHRHEQFPPGRRTAVRTNTTQLVVGGVHSATFRRLAKPREPKYPVDGSSAYGL
jgi:hypothetical protein